MIRSMTAYARSQTTVEMGDITWELRSLNARYLEVHMKLPDEWRPLEIAAREKLGKALKRGKIECNFRFQRKKGEAPNLVLNRPLANKLHELAMVVAEIESDAGPLRAIDILRWPGMIVEEEQDVTSISDVVLQALDVSIAELVKMREREGSRLRKLILERCDGLQVLTDKAKKMAPDIKKLLAEKISIRLRDLSVKVDDARLEQELAIQLQKLDVDEELDRLGCHIQEIRENLEGNGSVGRRLDFLMQELNREANTLGSKAASVDVSGISVELKVLIEQIREQVQNIE